ncbi:MAG TPA: hypothetical protein VFQ35_13635 [Polyangiaceae bacterium]|nr:hypothetical protein [Polyangiaceae bacterium]
MTVDYQGYQAAPTRFSRSDQSDLNTLAVCHYVYAALLAVGGLIPLGISLVAVGFFSAMVPSHEPALKGLVGGALLLIWGAIGLLLWLKAGFVAYSGLSLRRGQHRTLSIVVACLCCLNMPLGTLLGVFTLIVLNRPAVRAGYESLPP